MKKTYSKQEFINLDFDDKCIIFETVLPDEYFQGLKEIGFYFPADFAGGTDVDLPETPPEIKTIEDEKMQTLVEELTANLFVDKEVVEFDPEIGEEEI